MVSKEFLSLSQIFTYHNLAHSAETMCTAVCSEEAGLKTVFCQTVMLNTRIQSHLTVNGCSADEYSLMGGGVPTARIQRLRE